MSMTLEPAIDIRCHRLPTNGFDISDVDFTTDYQSAFGHGLQTSIPTRGMPAEYVSALISGQLLGDGDPAFNLGTFSTTSRDLHKDHLVLQAINKNLVDQNAYPEMNAIHERVIAMLARLFHAPLTREGMPTGTATAGSSEAIMLGLLAHKFAWREKCEQQKRQIGRPNIVMGSNVHVCWHKFARFFDVEARIVNPAGPKCILTADQVAGAIDENTIAVGAVLGNTYTGQLDEIEQINGLLCRVKQERGLDIPIHVDAASGGFVLPFAHPKIRWDFRLEQVKSINVSCHKYGMAYTGLGALLLRDPSVLSDQLIFDISYTGGCMSNFGLNFSQPSAMLLIQYFNFLHLGETGYESMVECALDNARYLEQKLLATGYFENMSCTELMPIVVPRIKDAYISEVSVYEICRRLRERSWIVPAYALPINDANPDVMRMVIKQNWSRDLTDRLVRDIIDIIQELCLGIDSTTEC